MDMEMDTSLNNTITEDLKAMNTTKICGCLIFALTSEKDKAKLRGLVHQQLKLLMGIVGKGNEKKCIPLVLLDKANAVLKGEAC
eukprot:6490998-Amphidinium_carterae.4